MGCFATLVFFNLLTYLMGINTSFLNFSSILGLLITVGIIAVALAMIPLTYGGGAIKWFLSIIVLISILFSVSFTILTSPIQIGLGLCTNLMNLFPSSILEPAFAGYLFFLTLGILAIIDVVMSVSAGD